MSLCDEQEERIYGMQNCGLAEHALTCVRQSGEMQGDAAPADQDWVSAILRTERDCLTSINGKSPTVCFDLRVARKIG